MSPGLNVAYILCNILLSMQCYNNIMKSNVLSFITSIIVIVFSCTDSYSLQYAYMYSWKVRPGGVLFVNEIITGTD